VRRSHQLVRRKPRAGHHRHGLARKQALHEVRVLLVGIVYHKPLLHLAEDPVPRWRVVPLRQGGPPLAVPLWQGAVSAWLATIATLRTGPHADKVHTVGRVWIALTLSPCLSNRLSKSLTPSSVFAVTVVVGPQRPGRSAAVARRSARCESLPSTVGRHRRPPA